MAGNGNFGYLIVGNIYNFFQVLHLVEITENMRECRNQKDNKVLALALNEESQYIVTGDKDLLVLHPFRSAIIITVEEFLKTIKFE